VEVVVGRAEPDTVTTFLSREIFRGFHQRRTGADVLDPTLSAKCPYRYPVQAAVWNTRPMLVNPD
jgi:hypothetical protein